MKKSEIGNKLTVIFVIAIILIVNLIAQYLYVKVDLTEDKRYSLTQSTKDLLTNMDRVVYAEVLLDGKFPAGFQRLKNSTSEMLRNFKSYYPDLEYKFEDPNVGTLEEKKNIQRGLREEGVVGIRLTIKDGDDLVEKYIYPYILLHHAGRTVVVNLLEDQMDKNPEVVLNKSVSLLEYKLAEGLRNVVRTKKKNILFTSGHGELDKPRISQLRKDLKPYYNTGFIQLDSMYQIHPDLDLLVVAKPKTKFSDKEIFLLDQYIMSGGSVLWMIDKYNTNLDSIAKNRNYVPEPIETGLDDLFYRSGVRIEDDLIIDLEASKIPQIVGSSGGKPQFELFSWFYHPLLVPGSNHSIVGNIDRVNAKFPSSISMIKTKADIKKTTLLQSSQYSRLRLFPMQLSFEILRYKPDPKKYNNGNQAVAVLLEGEFESLFQNRVSEELKAELDAINVKFRAKGEPAKQIIISDADIAKSIFNPDNGKVYPVGYNKWEEKIYTGNKEFILNAINYLTSDSNILTAKSKNVKLRLLNKVKIEKEQMKWQFINVLLPVLIILLFGLIYNWRRKQKYSKA